MNHLDVFTLWSQNILPLWWCHLEPEAVTFDCSDLSPNHEPGLFLGKMYVNIWGLAIILSVNTEEEELMCYTAANHKGAIEVSWPNFGEKTLRMLQICSEILKWTVFKNWCRNDPKFRCIGIFRAELTVSEKLGLCGGQRKWEGSVVSERKYQSRIDSSRTLEWWRWCGRKQEVKTGTVSSGGDEHEGLTFWSGLSRPDRRMPQSWQVVFVFRADTSRSSIMTAGRKECQAPPPCSQISHCRMGDVVSDRLEYFCGFSSTLYRIFSKNKTVLWRKCLFSLNVVFILPLLLFFL